MLAGLIVILASNVSNQISVNNTQATDTNPRAGNVSDFLSASFDVNDNWVLDLGLTISAESETPAAKQAQFDVKNPPLTMFTGGLDWYATDDWTFGLTLGYAPPATQQTAADITVGTLQTQALIESRTSEFDVGADVSWDTGGESDLEWYFGAGLSGMHLTTDQAVTRIGRSTLTQLRNACATQPTRRVCQAITPVAVTLDSERFSLTAAATLWRNNDVSVTGDFYHYQQDPKAVLYPSIAAAQLGMGMPIAPLQYLIRAEYLRRFGDFQAKLWVAAGQYAEGTADTTRSIGLKLQYKFTRSFKLWLSASGQSDVAAVDTTTVNRAGETIRSTTVALGGQYRW